MVLEGRIRVNGQMAQSAGIEVDQWNDTIEIDGKIIDADKDSEKIYILLNKLPGYISSTARYGEPTVMDLVPDLGTRLYPVGRLDKDTEGLILITNDGDLTYRLTHPKHHIDKVYIARVSGDPTDDSLDKLRRGIMLEDGMTLPAVIQKEGDHIRVTIHEGRKRQIKRMFAAIGHRVIGLKRIQLGTIELGDLPPGKYRFLSKEEIESLSKFQFKLSFQKKF